MKLFRMAVVLLALAMPAAAQEGPGNTFNHPLLDHMVGAWDAAGTITSQKAEHRVEVRWTLNHQFLAIHETSLLPGANGEPPYESMPFLGYDATSERYVMHWIDVFGGRF